MTEKLIAFPEGLDLASPLNRQEVVEDLNAAGITSLTIERGRDSQTLYRVENGWSYTLGTVLD